MSTPGAVRYYEHELAVYRRLWRGSLASSFLAPVLFLLAIGGTLGKSIDQHAGLSQFGGATYLAWLAPGLLAANAMQIAMNECMHPVLGGFKWSKNFIAAHVTPITPQEIVTGWLAWVTTRTLLMSTVFVLVAAVFKAAHSPWIIAAIPVAGLTGLAFAAPATAWAATRQRDDSFSALQRFGVLPLFLFSGTFFPITQLPVGIRPIAYALPLWHGVALCRAFALGTAALGSALIHVAVLVVYAVIGWFLSVRMFQRRLET